MAEDCRLISFDDFVRPQAQIVLRSSPQSLNPITSMILKGNLKGFIIQDNIIIRNQVISYKVWEINWKSAQTRSNYSSWLSQIFFLCKGEIIRGHYRIYEIPVQININSYKEWSEHEVDYQACPNTYASGRFLEFFMNGGMDLQKKFKIYFRTTSDAPETLGGAPVETPTDATMFSGEKHQMVCDYYDFEKYVREKQGDKKKITNSLVYTYATDWALQYQSVIPYIPTLKGDQNRKAIARMFINSPFYQSLQ